MRQMIKTLLNKSLSIHRLTSHLRFIQIHKMSQLNQMKYHNTNQLTATETTVKNHIYMQYHGGLRVLFREQLGTSTAVSAQNHVLYYYITTNYRSIVHE
jgi:hypothetical protein